MRNPRLHPSYHENISSAFTVQQLLLGLCSFCSEWSPTLIRVRSPGEVLKNPKADARRAGDPRLRRQGAQHAELWAEPRERAASLDLLLPSVMSVSRQAVILLACGFTPVSVFI